MTIFIGLDVHSKETFFCAQDGEGQVVAEGAVETTREGIAQLLARCGAVGATQVALETGGQATWVSCTLDSLGMAPVVVNAREVRAKARRARQKSDRRDAFEICDGLRRGIYTSIVWVPPACIQQMREVLSRRRHFVRQATAQINAAKFVLRSHALSGSGPLSLARVDQWQRMMERADLEPLRPYLAMHAEMWKQARSHVETLEVQLAKAIGPMSDVFQLLMSAPGVGPVTAATYVATIGSPGRFADSAHVASYIGLVPSTYDSGERERHGSITKCGCPALRAALVEAALHAHKAQHPLHPYYARVAAKAGHKKATVAVAARLARILYQMWRKDERFDVRKLNVELAPKTLSRTVYYQIRRKPASAA